MLFVFVGLAFSVLALGKNVCVMKNQQETGSIDPQRGSDYTEAMALVNLYDTLVFPNTAGVMEPKLAESWTASPDGLSYTFRLKVGVRFHDGTEVTAEDVKFSMDRSLALEEGYSWLWADIIDEVTVDDTYVVTFYLTSPFAPFVGSLTSLWVANKDLVLAHAGPGDFGEFGDYGMEWFTLTEDEDAGSGPYMLKNWDRGREIVFERFLNYFEGWPHGDKSIDEFHSLLIKEAATTRTMLRNGELTLTDHWLAFEDYEEIDGYPNAQLVSFMSTEQYNMKLNTKKPPLDDIHIRRMIAWATDYDAVYTQIEPGCGEARGIIPSTIPGHNPRVFQYYFDLDKAREELEQSKYYPNVPPIEIVWPTGTEYRLKIAADLQKNLAKLGVELVLNPQTWGRMCELSTTLESTPHIMGISTPANYPDPDSYFYPIYYSKAAGTFFSTEWLHEPMIDELIDAERKELDPEERTHLMNVLQQVILERCPDVFVFIMPLRIGVQNYLKGFTPRPVQSFYYYPHDWWFEK